MLGAFSSFPNRRDTVPSAKEARAWVAQGGLHGIGDSLYTPFKGPEGDDIDWDAYRYLVRYCVGDLGHAMLWLTSGIAEWWSLTMDERKQLLEVAVEEARAVAPDTVIQACTIANSAKDCLELTLHAQEAGADICFLQAPPMEAHGGEGVLRYFKYIAERTDIALGIFPSPSSGYLMTARELALIAEEIPAVCAVKEGQLQPAVAKALHELAPELFIWECDYMVYQARWLQKGIVGAAMLGASGYLSETPDRMMYSGYWQMIWAGRIEEALAYGAESGLDRLSELLGPWYTTYPGRPGYFSHWGEAFKYAASVLGLPAGEYPHSRPPQGILPEDAKRQIRRAYETIGMAKETVAV
jgi:4-hydroxy-tetrahydrodipicolinate synthase